VRKIINEYSGNRRLDENFESNLCMYGIVRSNLFRIAVAAHGEPLSTCANHALLYLFCISPKIYDRCHNLLCRAENDGAAASTELKTADLPDATYMKCGTLYRWRDTWTMARGRDCMYIWSAAAALELSYGSNGWFRYILDGKLSTMYSSGSPEDGSDSSGKTADPRARGSICSRAN